LVKLLRAFEAHFPLFVNCTARSNIQFGFKGGVWNALINKGNLGRAELPILGFGSTHH
jgi:hypothetical protein